MTKQGRMLAATLTSLAAGIQATPVPGWAHVLILAGLLVAGAEGAAYRSRRIGSRRIQELMKIQRPVDGANTKASRA